jgi:hypothetical protein
VAHACSATEHPDSGAGDWFLHPDEPTLGTGVEDTTHWQTVEVDMTAEVVDGFVNSQLQYFKKLKAEAEALRESFREELRSGTVTLSRDELNTLLMPNQVASELAYGLDEAMAALKFYANENTWTEVPAKTFAADDRGLKARVALARINPI